MSAELKYIGKFTGTHGLSGLLKVVFDVLFFEELFPYLRDECGKLLNCKYERFYKGSLHLLSFPELNHIDLVQKFVDSDLFVNIGDLEQNSDLFLELQIKGLSVFDQSQKDYGKVVGLCDFGGGTLMRIEKNNDYEFLPLCYIQEIIKSEDKLIVQKLEFA